MRPLHLIRSDLVPPLLGLSTLVSAAEPAKARVMLIGMFHFANPGRDMVKSGVIDVMTPQNQTYLDGLAEPG